MNTLQKCWWCQNVVAEATMQDHARSCLALNWVAQRKAGTPEDQITYHPHRHVRWFINKGWEELGRKERAPKGGRGEKKREQNKDGEAGRGGATENREEVEAIKKT